LLNKETDRQTEIELKLVTDLGVHREIETYRR
jgi:hypothetical protein